MPRYNKDFVIDNGKEGLERVVHTPTGYECPVAYPDFSGDLGQHVMFFAKHVVGSDGRPYTDIGLSHLDEREKTRAMDEMRRKLNGAGFKEVTKMSECDKKDEYIFSEQFTPDHNSVSIRLNSGKNGIVLAVEALGEMILESSKKFVKEQEKVDDIIYKSIMNTLGEELEKGPGGKKMAKKKARDLADTFETGFEVKSSKTIRLR